MVVNDCNANGHTTAKISELNSAKHFGSVSFSSQFF